MAINTEFIFNREALEKAKQEETLKELNPYLAKIKHHSNSVINPNKGKNKAKRKKKKKDKYRKQLQIFWATVPKTGNARQKKLRDLAKYKVGKTTAKDLAATRYAFDQKKYGLLRLDKCFICNQKAEHRHHIVQLQHGGSNIKENLVGLCELCHTSIHPFMLDIQETMVMEERLGYLTRYSK